MNATPAYAFRVNDLKALFVVLRARLEKLGYEVLPLQESLRTQFSGTAKGNQLYYDPSLPEDYTIAVILHELIHKMQEPFYRGRGWNGDIHEALAEYSTALFCYGLNLVEPGNLFAERAHKRVQNEGQFYSAYSVIIEGTAFLLWDLLEIFAFETRGILTRRGADVIMMDTYEG